MDFADLLAESQKLGRGGRTTGLSGTAAQLSARRSAPEIIPVQMSLAFVSTNPNREGGRSAGGAFLQLKPFFASLAIGGT